MSEFEDSRREFLIRLLVTGAYTGTASNLLLPTHIWAEEFEELSGQLEPGRSIYNMKG